MNEDISLGMHDTNMTFETCMHKMHMKHMSIKKLAIKFSGSTFYVINLESVENSPKYLTYQTDDAAKQWTWP